MRALRILALLGVCLSGVGLFPGVAHAVPERKVLSVENTQGVWFRQDVADRLLGDFKQATELRDKYAARVTLLEQKLEIRGEELALHVRMRELAEAGEAKAVGALSAAIQARRMAELDRDAWHRNRGLWFGVGVLATAIAVVTTAYALH